MGAVELEAGEGRLVLTAPSGLHGAEITLRFPSVGATETLLLAAVKHRNKMKYTVLFLDIFLDIC